MKWVLILSMAARLSAACQVVDGDRILGKDLLAANPQFAGIDPGLSIGFSPLPGVQRVFHPEELARLARVHQIALDAPVQEVCFELATEKLGEGNILPVLRSALGIEDAKIEILDFSRYGVPRGALEFKRSGLSGSGIWRGRVAYSENRSALVWVKVRITTEQTWVEASQELDAGKAVDPERLVLRKGARYPLGLAPLASVEQAAGRLPVRTIKPGETVFASMLLAPREIERGDKVAVEVFSGEARLSFDATAESSGRLGEFVLIRNPDNGKFFKAQVEGKGKVCVRK